LVLLEGGGTLLFLPVPEMYGYPTVLCCFVLPSGVLLVWLIAVRMLLSVLIVS